MPVRWALSRLRHQAFPKFSSCPYTPHPCLLLSYWSLSWRNVEKCLFIPDREGSGRRKKGFLPNQARFWSYRRNLGSQTIARPIVPLLYCGYWTLRKGVDLSIPAGSPHGNPHSPGLLGVSFWVIARFKMVVPCPTWGKQLCYARVLSRWTPKPPHWPSAPPRFGFQMLSLTISQSHGLLNFLGPFDKVFLNHDSLPSPQASLLPKASPGSSLPSTKNAGILSCSGLFYKPVLPYGEVTEAKFFLALQAITLSFSFHRIELLSACLEAPTLNLQDFCTLWWH